MTERIAQIRQEAEAAIAAAASTDALEDVRIRYLGRKAELPNLLRTVAQLPPEERAATGKAANEARQALESLIDRRTQELAAAELHERPASDRDDVTHPSGPATNPGTLHLVTHSPREIE